MNTVERIKSKYLAFGYVKRPISSHFQEKLMSLGNVKTIDIGEDGFMFYSPPGYADVAENGDMVCIQIGRFHENLARLIYPELVLEKGYASSKAIDLDRFWGNGVVITLGKNQPQIQCFRTLLSVSTLYYWAGEGSVILTNNLALMCKLMPQKPEMNEAILPNHFLYLSAAFDQSYVKDVQELRGGELLTWRDGQMKVELKRTLRDFKTDPSKGVTPETVDQFYSKFRSLLSLYLDGNIGRSATMLSGGVDSSLIQAAINDHPAVDFPFPTFSYVIESPGFRFETEYAQEAVNKLGTQHTFVNISAEKYLDSLVESIMLVGQPMPFDVPSNFLYLAQYLDVNYPNIVQLFHGQIADGLNGIYESIKVVQGDKYRKYPIPLLALLGILLKPISQSKSYGATMAANTLRTSKYPNLPDHYLNSMNLYTDLELVYRLFGQNTVSNSFMARRKVESRYLKSAVFVEKLNALDLLTDSVLPATLELQLGLAYEKEYIFPFADESILSEIFSIEPVDRYCHGHRVKPVLKAALEKQKPTMELNSPKGNSSFFQSITKWMREGSLREITHDISHPDFISVADFQEKLKNPDMLTWKLLTLDLFKKHVVS